MTTTETTSAEQQKEEETFLIFFAPMSNTYRRRNYPKYSKTLHISRKGNASILKSTVRSCCGLVNCLSLSFSDNQWLLITRSELYNDEKISKHLCKRCLEQVESVIPAGEA